MILLCYWIFFPQSIRVTLRLLIKRFCFRVNRGWQFQVYFRNKILNNNLRYAIPSIRLSSSPLSRILPRAGRTKYVSQLQEFKQTNKIGVPTSDLFHRLLGSCPIWSKVALIGIWHQPWRVDILNFWSIIH